MYAKYVYIKGLFPSTMQADPANSRVSESSASESHYEPLYIVTQNLNVLKL